MQPGETVTTLPQPTAATELKGLVERAKSGDVTALPRLRELLDQHPEVWQHVGDLERIVVRSWADLLAGDNPLALEAIKRQAEQLRAELEGKSPTPLEKLLVGQVISCWLEMSHAQVQAAEPGSQTLSRASYVLKRAESVQKRYLAAVRALTTVRTLLPRGLLPVHQLGLFDPDKKAMA